MKQLIIDNIQLTEIVLPLIDGKPPVTMTSRDGSVNIRYEEVDDERTLTVKENDIPGVMTKQIEQRVLKDIRKRLADARQMKCPTT